MVELVKLRNSNLHTSANGEVKSFCDWKGTQDDSGCHEDLFFPSRVPLDQNSEFCSSIGQILPLIL